MISHAIFIWSLVGVGICFLFLLIKSFVRDFFKKKNFILNFISDKIVDKLVYVLIIASILSIVLGHIVPYISQQRDYMLVDEYKANIWLYRKYSSEYEEEARKQIEEYRKYQSEAARNANAIQLQFYSNEENSIGDQLTNTIKEFQDLILKQELAINKAQARINRRPYNVWYFWIEEKWN